MPAYFWNLFFSFYLIFIQWQFFSQAIKYSVIPFYIYSVKINYLPMYPLSRKYYVLNCYFWHKKGIGSFTTRIIESFEIWFHFRNMKLSRLRIENSECHMQNKFSQVDFININMILEFGRCVPQQLQTLIMKGTIPDDT